MCRFIYFNINKSCFKDCICVNIRTSICKYVYHFYFHDLIHLVGLLARTDWPACEHKIPVQIKALGGGRHGWFARLALCSDWHWAMVHRMEFCIHTDCSIYR